MNNKKRIIIILVLLFGLIFIGATYAFWTWNSSTPKNVVINTAGKLKNYIIYDEGESKFSGNFEATSDYTNGMHSTISLYKTNEASNVDLVATINMTINSIGDTMKQSPALKWKVTEGTISNIGNTLAEGNFLGINNGDTLTLARDIEVTTTETFYTIWIWLDINETPSSNLAGETLDTDIWTEIDQLSDIEDRLVITQAYAKYQVINATVRDNKHQITNYAVTTSDIEPSNWENIPSNEQGNIYRLNYAVPATGLYYVWFKDTANKLVSKSVDVRELDLTAPTFNIEATSTGSVINARIIDIVETDSGLSGTYYWKVSTSNVCDNTTSDFVSTSSAFYEFTIPASGKYYVCAKVGDNGGNYGYNSIMPISKIYAYLGGQNDYYKATAYRDNITSISFVNEINIPDNATNWSVGTSPSDANDVKAWLEDDGSSNNTFALKIGANGNILATNLSYAFYYLANANNFVFEALDTSETTNMSYMFSSTSRNATNPSLNLGNSFNTINVTNMASMFATAGYNATNFSLNLGNNFNTINVTNMASMFSGLGEKNTTNFSLNLGNDFDTSNVTNMESMFSSAGNKSTAFSLDLGNKFNTAKVTNMSHMFYYTGAKTSNINLNLGNKFNTANVSNMSSMFSNAFGNVIELNINLGEHFNTEKVTNMAMMFDRYGMYSNNFNLNLGNNFNTANVTNMANMFSYIGYKAATLNLHLGNNFDAGNVTSMNNMFYRVGESTPNINIYLGNNFNASKVTNTQNMFASMGNYATTFSLDLGNNFNIGQATINMNQMFANMGGKSQNWSLNLGNNFNGSKIRNWAVLFASLGGNATNFNLNLGAHFNTINATNMSGLFSTMATNAGTVNISLGNHFNTAKVTDMSMMFTLTGEKATSFNINLGNKFNMSNVTNTYLMFYETANKTKTRFTLDLSAGNFSKITNNYAMFFDIPNSYVTIYVKDSTARQWIINGNSNWGTSFSASNVLIK